MTPDTFVSAVPLPAVYIRRDRRIGAFNSAARVEVGASIAGRHYATLFRQPDLVEQIEACLNDAARSTCRILLETTGREKLFDVHVSPVEGVGGALLVLSDVTALHDTGRMRTDFVANVSHELRTPLTALSGFIETLRGPARDDEQARDRFLAIMGDETERMKRLISDLLSLARIEHLAGPPPDKPTDICALLRDTINALSHRDDVDAIAVNLHGCDQHVTVPGDPDLLRLVLNNLLDNAIKYGGDNGVDVTMARHDKYTGFPGPVLTIAVRDHGEGIANHHLPRLTERFYRIDKHRSRGMGGTGLGLAIVKNVLSLHRGRLKIDSTPGEGSKFTAILPAS